MECEATAKTMACVAMCVCRAEGRLGTSYHTPNCPFIQWPRVFEDVTTTIQVLLEQLKADDGSYRPPPPYPDGQRDPGPYGR